MKIFKTTILFLLPFASLFAQTYTLEALIERVESDNREIALKELDIKIAAQKIAKADALAYGKAGAAVELINTSHPGNIFGLKMAQRETTFNDFGFDQFLGWMNGGMQGDILSTAPENLNHPGSFTSMGAKLTYTLPLYTAERLANYKKIAKQMHNLAAIDLEKAREQKIFEVKKGYYDALLIEDFLQNLESIRSTTGRLESTVEAMIEEGYAKNIDLLEVRAKLAHVNRLINESEANLQLVLRFLSFLVADKVSGVAGDFATLAYKGYAQDEVKTATRYREMEHKSKMAALGEEIAKAAYYPKLGLHSEVGSSFNEIDGIGDANHYTLALGMEYTLFDGGVRASELERSRLKRLQADIGKRLVEEAISLKAAKMDTAIRSSIYHIESLEEELELKEQIYRNYLARYEENLVSINDVLIKHAQHLQSALELKELQNRKNAQVLELEMVLSRER